MNNQENKWIKISVVAALPSEALGAASFLSNFSPGQLRSIASNIFRVKGLRDMFSAKFPGFGGGVGLQVFTENFMDSLKDPAFQVLAVTAIQHMMGLGATPQEQYKTQAFEQLFGTKGYGGQSIAAGAYQKTTGKLPPREILPTMTVAQFEAQLRNIGNDPNLRPAEKMKKLSDFLKTVEGNMNSFINFIDENIPFVKQLAGR